MKKSEWQPVYEKILPFIEDTARTHYDGDNERGFKLWAVSQALMETDLSDDELKDPLRLDGRGDLGLDGYYEDTEDTERPTLVLVQSKFHDQPVSIGNDDINRFLSCLRKVLDPEVVVATKNPLAQDAHRAVRDAISKSWTLRFVFVSSGYLSPEGRVFVDANATQTESIESVEVRKELEVYDVEGLAGLYDSHLSPLRFNTNVELLIDSSNDFTRCNVANFNVLVANIAAAEIVKAFRQHQYALFRLNPRGPLHNKVNSRIMETLKDANKRNLFFHLNNGITAVCDSFKPVDGRIVVRDFQIVNGCQTTVTLAKAGAIVEADRNIRVLLRLIEGLAGLSPQIATATNLQARLSAQDFKSNDPLQKDLKNQFNALPAPILYEVKRGDWEMAHDLKRYKQAESGVYRRIKMKDLAQAALAFLGKPGVAKDRSRAIFEDESLYKSVFPNGVRAQQLLLPWQVYQEANRACSEWATFPGADYARFAITALVGLELVPSQKLPTVQEAAKLAAQTDRIQASVKRAQQTIPAVVAGLDEYPGHREFFRSADHFQRLVKTYRAQPA